MWYLRSLEAVYRKAATQVKKKPTMTKSCATRKRDRQGTAVNLRLWTAHGRIMALAVQQLQTKYLQPFPLTAFSFIPVVAGLGLFV